MRRLIMLIVVGVFVAACGGSAGDVAVDEVPDTATGGAAASPAAPDGDTADAGGPSEIAPFGVVETVSGEVLDGADYAGSNLALWFWAPW